MLQILAQLKFGFLVVLSNKYHMAELTVMPFQQIPLNASIVGPVGNVLINEMSYVRLFIITW